MKKKDKFKAKPIHHDENPKQKILNKLVKEETYTPPSMEYENAKKAQGK